MSLASANVYVRALAVVRLQVLHASAMRVHAPAHASAFECSYLRRFFSREQVAHPSPRARLFHVRRFSSLGGSISHGDNVGPASPDDGARWLWHGSAADDGPARDDGRAWLWHASAADDVGTSNARDGASARYDARPAGRGSHDAWNDVCGKCCNDGPAGRQCAGRGGKLQLFTKGSSSPRVA